MHASDVESTAAGEEAGGRGGTHGVLLAGDGAGAGVELRIDARLIATLVATEHTLQVPLKILSTNNNRTIVTLTTAAHKYFTPSPVPLY